MKNCIKILGFALLAEALTLFVNLTLSFSGSAFIRMLCSACTVGILCGLMAQGGYSIGNIDRKAKKTFHFGKAFLLGLWGSAPYFILTIALILSKNGMISDNYYRYYKLLCAPFLAVCNLISDGISSSGVSAMGIIVLLILCCLPCISIMIAYKISIQGKAIEDVMYH